MKPCTISTCPSVRERLTKLVLPSWPTFIRGHKVTANLRLVFGRFSRNERLCWNIPLVIWLQKVLYKAGLRGSLAGLLTRALTYKECYDVTDVFRNVVLVNSVSHTWNIFSEKYLQVGCMPSKSLPALSQVQKKKSSKNISFQGHNLLTCPGCWHILGQLSPTAPDPDDRRFHGPCHASSS